MSLLTQLPPRSTHQLLRSINLRLLLSLLRRSLRRKRNSMIGRTPLRMSLKLLLLRPRLRMFLSLWPRMRNSLTKKKRKKIPLRPNKQPQRRLARLRKARLRPMMLLQVALRSINLRTRRMLKREKLVRGQPLKSVKHSRNKVDRNKRSCDAQSFVSWVT